MPALIASCDGAQVAPFGHRAARAGISMSVARTEHYGRILRLVIGCEHAGSHRRTIRLPLPDGDSCEEGSVQKQWSGCRLPTLHDDAVRLKAEQSRQQCIHVIDSVVEGQRGLNRAFKSGSAMRQLGAMMAGAGATRESGAAIRRTRVCSRP